MQCKGWQQLRSNAKNGISMVVVMCVSAFFVAFAAAILYTAGTITAQSNSRLKEERCYQLAKSYGDVLNDELTRFDQKKADEVRGTFYAFANKFLDEEKYLEYNSEYEDSTKYNFVLSGTDMDDIAAAKDLPEGYGNLSVTLKKEKNTDENEERFNTGTLQVDAGVSDYTSKIAELENATLRLYLLTTDVTAYYDDVSYTYSTEYAREEKFKVSFSYKDTPIVWDGNDWRYGNTTGEICQFDAGTTITYRYDRTQPTSCVYKETTYQEGEDTDAEN